MTAIALAFAAGYLAALAVIRTRDARAARRVLAYLKQQHPEDFRG